MTVLAMLSPPNQGGVIAQAMAIQAHRPSTVLLIHVSADGQQSQFEGLELLKAWVHGSQSLMESFPNLDQPFRFPVTPPTGYISVDGKVPTILEIYCEKEEIADAFALASIEFGDEDVRYDFLPGGKLFKTPLLFDDRFRDYSACYTLENGDFMQFSESEMVQNKGHILSIVDRCWLAGYPVFVENIWPMEQQWVEFYEGVLRCLGIEVMSEEEELRLRSKTKAFTGFGPRKINRPIGFNGDSTVRKLRNSGYIVEENLPESLTISSSDKSLKWQVDLHIDGIPSGLPLELLMANELSKSWDMDEILQGISLIVPTSEGRISRFYSLVGGLRDEYDTLIEIHGEIAPHMSKSQKYMYFCDKHGFGYDVSIDDIVNAEFVQLNEDFVKESQDDPLARIRICEIDCLTLDVFGISSFDAKAAMGGGWPATDDPAQSAMQRPDFIRPTQYYAINCTNPDGKFSGRNILHVSRLNEGRTLLSNPLKYRWNPFDKQELLDEWKKGVDEMLPKSELDPFELVTKICNERLFQSWYKVRDMFFPDMMPEAVLIGTIEGGESSSLWVDYELRVEEAKERERLRKEAELQEISDQILAINPDIDTEGLGKTKLKILLKELIKAQKEVEKEAREANEMEKIREKLREKDPELDLDNLSLKELRKLRGKNKRRQNRLEIVKKPLSEEGEALVATIGEALLALLNGQTSSWKYIQKTISKHATAAQKNEHFSSEKFTIQHAIVYLNDYITITGKGNEAVVEPVSKKSE